MGKGAGDAAVLPKIFYVNWFRRDEDGRFLWPGFGENSRVLKWVVERLEGGGDAVETPIGMVPTPEALDTTGLDMSPEEVEAVLRVDVDEWRAEVPQVTEWFEQVRRETARRPVGRTRRTQGPPRPRVGTMRGSLASFEKSDAGARRRSRAGELSGPRGVSAWGGPGSGVSLGCQG